MEYKKISQVEAKRIMDNEEDIIILDVRTEEEFDEEHIDNAIVIPVDEIEERVESVLTEKAKKILVYCRSGKRSLKACEKLLKLGYTNVLDFGGIIDWNFELVM